MSESVEGRTDGDCPTSLVGEEDEGTCPTFLVGEGDKGT